MKIGHVNRRGLKLVGYHLYRSPEGCAEEYIGRADMEEEVSQMADSGGLPRYMWDTARAVGHCAGLSAPSLQEGEEEGESPLYWTGEDGYTAVVPIWKAEV